MILWEPGEIETNVGEPTPRETVTLTQHEREWIAEARKDLAAAHKIGIIALFMMCAAVGLFAGMIVRVLH